LGSRSCLDASARLAYASARLAYAVWSRGVRVAERRHDAQDPPGGQMRRKGSIAPTMVPTHGEVTGSVGRPPFESRTSRQAQPDFTEPNEAVDGAVVPAN
jgi:hypothetical protein